MSQNPGTHSAFLGQLSRMGTRSESMQLGFDATCTNKTSKAFVHYTATSRQATTLVDLKTPVSSATKSFVGRSPASLPDTNGSSTNSNELGTDSSREDIGATPSDLEAPDLSGLVSKLHKRPIFTSPYSKVYLGSYGSNKVAIKVLCVIKSDSVTDRKFRRERFIWWHLRHPNILPLYGYFEDDDGAEVSHALWAEGGNAAQYIQEDLCWEQRVNLLHDVTKGLQYLHGLEPCVVHGDLKPLNILIDKNGVGQLCDFGLARLIKAKSGSGMTTTTAHTGTVRYLAYELVKRNKANPTKATDMYALGCLVLEFIYKTPPHAGLDNLWKIPAAIGEGKPPAERPAHREEVPELWDLMEACWIIDPSERPSADGVCHYLDKNAHSLSRALETVHRVHPEHSDGPIIPPLSGPSIPAPPISPASPRPPPTQSPVVSTTSRQPVQPAFSPLSFEASGTMRSDCVKAQAAKDRDPFYRQVYRLLVDSCIQVRSKLSSLDLRHYFLSIRATQLRFRWGPSSTT